MRKYLLPSALILALAGSLAIAQTINKSIQLSQDNTGAFGVDTANNAYFPAHILTTGATPALTSCGGGTPTITGSDFGGTITEGTSPTGCTVTFAKAYLAAPYCVLIAQAANASPVAYSTSTTALTMTNATVTGLVFNYICTGLK